MKKNKIFISIIVILIIIFLILLFLPEEQEETIKIGFISPETGPTAYTGFPVKTSFELAHSQFNSIDNKKIEIIYEDGKCNPKEALTAATELINVKGVNIIVSGICSSSTLAIAPVTQEKQLILISPVAASPLITNAGNYIYRISSSSSLSAEKATFIIKSLNYSKIAIIYENNDYTIGWKNKFVEHFKKLNGEVIAEQSFNTNDKDIKTQLIKVNEKKPDAIFFAVLSVPSATLAVKQASELKIKAQLIGNELFSYKPILEDSSSNGMLVVNYDFDLKSEEMKKFLSDYNAYYGKPVTEEVYGVLGYDLYILLYNAIKSCNSDSPECIKNYLDNLNEIKGVSGTFTLDENGDAIRNFKVWKIENKKLNEI